MNQKMTIEQFREIKRQLSELEDKLYSIENAENEFIMQLKILMRII